MEGMKNLLVNVFQKMNISVNYDSGVLDIHMNIGELKMAYTYNIIKTEFE